MSHSVWGASDADCPLETSPPKGDAGDFLGPTSQARARPGGIPSAVLSTNRATQGRAGLVEKKLALPPEAKRALIEPTHPQLSIARQCDLVGLPRSTYYYHTQGERAENLALMHL